MLLLLKSYFACILWSSVQGWNEELYSCKIYTLLLYHIPYFFTFVSHCAWFIIGCVYAWNFIYALKLRKSMNETLNLKTRYINSLYSNIESGRIGQSKHHSHELKWNTNVVEGKQGEEIVERKWTLVKKLTLKQCIFETKT